MSEANEPEATRRGWAARLQLGFSSRQQRTVVTRHHFTGPLRIQRTFHPEDNGACHVYVLHPPGGVVGGDRLELELSVDSDAHALVTTPGATRLYRSAGARSLVRTTANVAAGGTLEWLPQGTIAFDAARAALELTVRVDPGGTFLGWEIMALGRPASAVPFATGSLSQRVELFLGDEPQLLERLRLGDGSAAARAPWGLAGNTVFGTFYCISPDAGALVDAVRGRAELAQHVSITQLGSATVTRSFGDNLFTIQELLSKVWALARACAGLDGAVPPRVWAT